MGVETEGTTGRSSQDGSSAFYPNSTPAQGADGLSPFYGLGHSEDLLLVLPIRNLHQTLESPNSVTGLSFYS